MKNKLKLIGIAAVAAVIGLSMVACGDDLSVGLPDVGVGGQNVTYFGQTLIIRGPVEWGFDEDEDVRSPANPNAEVPMGTGWWFWPQVLAYEGHPGSGTIAQGQLFFTAGAPSEAVPVLEFLPELAAAIEDEDFNPNDPADTRPRITNEGGHAVSIFWGLEFFSDLGVTRWEDRSLPRDEDGNYVVVENPPAEDRVNLYFVSVPDENGNWQPSGEGDGANTETLRKLVINQAPTGMHNVLAESVMGRVEYVWVSGDLNIWGDSDDLGLINLELRSGWNAVFVPWEASDDQVIRVGNPARAVWIAGPLADEIDDDD